MLTVALNYQTPGSEMQLNHALFQSNGLSGYVLKPEFMRQGNVNISHVISMNIHITDLSCFIACLRYNNSLV